MSEKDKTYCSFCGEPNKPFMVKGHYAAICHECIGVCVEAVYEDQKRKLESLKAAEGEE